MSFRLGRDYQPDYLALYHGFDLIQQVGPADFVEGKFVSLPFVLLGGVLICVRAGRVGADVFACIRLAAS